MKFQDFVNGGRRWLAATPERSLDLAYRAAIKIKAIEDEHFNGQIVSGASAGYSESVIRVFRSDVNNYLSTIKMRLAEFKLSRSLLIFSDTKPNNSSATLTKYNGIDGDRNLSIIEKLNFIDSVVNRYKERRVSEPSESPIINISSNQTDNNRFTAQRRNNFRSLKPSDQDLNTETVIDKTGVLPRSFMRTLSRIRQEIDPQAEESEEALLEKFRRSRNKTAISVRFLLILIIVPLMTHQLTKTFLVLPLVEKYFYNHQEQVLFINKDMEEEAFMELNRYEENLHFKSLLGMTKYESPEIEKDEIEKEVRLKAEELSKDFRDRGVNSVSNVFADMFSLMAFTAIIFFCRREVAIIKSFLDEIAYGLSDSAKAFLIILLTDMFVGYHSPHGWEVILEGISRHLGLPENRDFNFLFIATFPVILDTVLKYWIFRYLNRISPSSVATYKNMNE
jgi:hypothetical protein